MRGILGLCFLLAFVMPVQGQDVEWIECRQQLDKALQDKNPDSLAMAYFNFSTYYAYRNIDSVRYFCSEGLKYVDKDNPDIYISLMVNLAETYFSEGDLKEAKKRYRFIWSESLRLHSDVSLQTTILGSLGVIYRRQSMPDSALVCYQKAVKLIEGAGIYDEEAYLLTNIAILYANTDRPKEADFYANRAVQVGSMCNDMDVMMYAALSAGAISTNLGKYDEAANHMRVALRKARKQHKPRIILKGLTYMLALYQRTGQRDSIATYLDYAVRTVPLLPSSSSEVQGFRETQYRILTALGRFSESLAVQKQLFEVDTLNLQASMDKLYFDMAKNYAALKEYDKAVMCYEKAAELADSLRQVEIDDRLSELSVKFQAQEKEMAIAQLTQKQLEQETRTMKWTVVASASMLVLLVVLSYWFYRYSRAKREEELKLANSYIKGLERERLRLAKDLHDGVCNDLLGIGMQMEFMDTTEQSKREVRDLLERVRMDVRSISHELMPPQFQNFTLVDTLKDYINHIACPGTINIRFECEKCYGQWGQVPDRVSYEVYRIAQEWLSNIVKHANASEVTVRLILHKSSLEMFVVNNGSADFSDCGRSNAGIGLITIQERVKAIGATLNNELSDGMQVFKLVVPLPN